MSAEKSNQIKILHSFLRYPHEENPISHFPYNRTTKEEREGKETVSTDFTAIEKYDTSI
jgi:hypothetical protein